MNKKTITAFLLSVLILGQGFVTNIHAQESNVQAKENNSNDTVQSSSINDTVESQYWENHNFIRPQMTEANEDFSLGTKGRRTYTYYYTATVNKVNMKISFNKRARNFEVLLKNSSGRTVASRSFPNWYAPDGSKGVKRVHLRGNTKVGEKYTIEIINYDSVFVNGSINIIG